MHESRITHAPSIRRLNRIMEDTLSSLYLSFLRNAPRRSPHVSREPNAPGFGAELGLSL